jgi:hypothetical protein
LNIALFSAMAFAIPSPAISAAKVCLAGLSPPRPCRARGEQVHLPDRHGAGERKDPEDEREHAAIAWKS